MKEEIIIEKYFEKRKTIFGNRYCTFDKDWRINRKGILQRDFCTSDDGGSNYWEDKDWLDFHEYLEKINRRIENRLKEIRERKEKIENLDWDF